MSMPQALKRFLQPALMILLGLVGLYVVTLVYATGESLLAGVMLVTLACFLWIYTSPKTYAYRYLFPGIGAALIFVVFPMLYTVRIGFTNYSSKNLLTFNRATQYLLEETYRAEGATYNSTLHADGNRWRLRLEDADSGAAFVTEPLTLTAEKPLTLTAEPSPAPLPGAEMSMRDLIGHQAFLKGLTVLMPDGGQVRMTGLREFAPARMQYTHNPDGSLTNNQDHSVIRPNMKTGFYETSSGETVDPGFQVDVGWKHYVDIFTDAGLREPFWRIFVWTIVFSTLSVVFCTSLAWCWLYCSTGIPCASSRSTDSCSFFPTPSRASFRSWCSRACSTTTPARSTWFCTVSLASGPPGSPIPSWPRR